MEVATEDEPAKELRSALQMPKIPKSTIKKLYTKRIDLMTGTDQNTMRRVFWETQLMVQPEGAKLAGYFLCEIGTDSFIDLLVKIVSRKEISKAHLEGIGEALNIAYRLADKNQNELDIVGIEQIWEFVLQNSVIAQSPLDQRFSYIAAQLESLDRTKYDVQLQRILNTSLSPYSRCMDSKVRLETMNYMFKFFPLFPVTREDREKLIIDYLNDECVEIRCQTIMKFLMLMETYMPFLDDDFIRQAMVQIVDDMANDINITVRACVFKGLRILSESAGAINIFEHAMKCIVPSGINDKNEKVRLACFQLLNGVKQHRFIRIWDVIDFETVLARFEVEMDEKVLEQIVTLLFASFHPRNSTTAMAIARLEKLIKDGGRNAAVNFCRLIYPLHLIQFDEALRLVQTIFAFHIYPRWKRNDQEGVDLSRMQLNDSILDATAATMAEDKENQSFNVTDISSIDPVTPEFSRRLILFECAVILWKSIQDDLEKDRDKEVTLEKIISKLHHVLQQNYADAALVGASYALATLFRTKEAKEKLDAFARREIANLRSGEYAPENLGFMLDFIWKQKPEGLLDALLEDLDVLSRLTPEDLNSPQKKKRKKQSTVDKPVDCLQRVPVIMRHLTSSPKISSELAINHSSFLDKFYEILAPSVPHVIMTYFSTIVTREVINGQMMIELIKVYLVTFEQLISSSINVTTEARKIISVLDHLKTFIDWLSQKLIPLMDQLVDDSDPRWLDAFKIIESVFEVVPLVLGLLKSSDDWKPLGGNVDDVNNSDICEQLFLTISDLLQGLMNKNATMQQLLLVLTSTKKLAVFHDMSRECGRKVKNLLLRVGSTIPGWAEIMSDELNNEQLVRSTYAFYQLIFDRTVCDQESCEKIVRSLVKTILKGSITTLESNHNVEDPREHNFEILPIIHLFVQRVGFRQKNFLKLFTTSVINVIQANYLPNDALELDSLLYRIGAAAQLAYLSDPGFMNSKKKSEIVEHSETLRQMLVLLRARVSELLERNGKMIELEDGSQACTQINDDGLLNQIKLLVEFEESTAFD